MTTTPDPLATILADALRPLTSRADPLAADLAAALRADPRTVEWLARRLHECAAEGAGMALIGDPDDLAAAVLAIIDAHQCLDRERLARALRRYSNCRRKTCDFHDEQTELVANAYEADHD
jgi:16S rRNA G1207 methylase RsmC